MTTPSDSLDLARAPSAEEARLADRAVQSLLAASALAMVRDRFVAGLAAVSSLAQAHAHVDAEGAALWRAAQREMVSSRADDRPLYWARLQLAAYLRCDYAPSFALSGAARDALLSRLERASRGMTALAFDDAADKRILVAGFDPFRLDAAIDRSNPSGAAALTLADETLTTGSLRAQVRAALFPVRFRDFDEGLVEEVFRPFLEPRDAVDMVVTISQNNTPGFALEHWAARRRTREQTDNLGQYGDQTTVRGTGPCLPLGASAGEQEFEQTGLPLAAMKRAAGALGSDTVRVNESREPAGDGLSIRGSGGSFLSNEIFYRVASLERTTRVCRGRTRPPIPVGHLHVPLLEPPHLAASADAYAARRQEIVENVRILLTAALSALG